MKETFESKYDKHQPNRGFEGTVSSRNLYVLLKAAPASLLWNWAIYRILSINVVLSSALTAKLWQNG